MGSNNRDEGPQIVCQALIRWSFSLFWSKSQVKITLQIHLSTYFMVNKLVTWMSTESLAPPAGRLSECTAAPLTVNVVLQHTDTLLIQSHHPGQVSGLWPRVDDHLWVESLPCEPCVLLVITDRNWKRGREWKTGSVTLSRPGGEAGWTFTDTLTVTRNLQQQLH